MVIQRLFLVLCFGVMLKDSGLKLQGSNLGVDSQEFGV
jgi:hypothetical protein